MKHVLASLAIAAALNGAASPQMTITVEASANSEALPVVIDADLGEIRDILVIAAPIKAGTIAGMWIDAAGARTVVPVQFSPAVSERGILAALPPGGSGRLTVDLTGDDAPQFSGYPVHAVVREGTITVENEFFSIMHSRARGGMPSAITFRKSGDTFTNFVLNDRLFQKEKGGGYWLRADTNASVRLLAAGPIAAVIETEARYMSERGVLAPGGARARYRFTYYAASPYIRVSAAVGGNTSGPWREIHFMEINVLDDSVSEWQSGGMKERAKLTAEKKAAVTAQWAALIGKNNVIGLKGTKQIMYDGRGGYGTYIKDGSITTWGGGDLSYGSFLYVGSTDDAAFSRIGTHIIAPPSARISLDSIDAAITECMRLDAKDKGRRAWLLSIVRAKAAAGDLRGAIDVLTKIKNADTKGLSIRSLPWFTLSANDITLIDDGRIGIGIRKTNGNAEIASVFDLTAERELLAGPTPLWSLLLSAGAVSRAIDASAANVRCSITPGTGKSGLVLRWSADGDWKALDVRSDITLADGKISLGLAVKGMPDAALTEVIFPRWKFSALESPDDDVLAIAARSGVLHRSPTIRPVSHGVTHPYPTGEINMAFAAQYDDKSGVYFAAEDPKGSFKYFEVQSGDGEVRHAVRWTVGGIAIGNSYSLPGKAALAVFTGDWFDASRMYRTWVRREAKWMPPMNDNGRTDTPQWFKDIGIWALGSSSDILASNTARMADYARVPAAIHWYSWHNAPFDNDYPNYFPERPVFRDGISLLHASNVKVMPYINGRLWDTRDKEIEDYRFSAEGLAGAAKNETNGIYAESYSSKEKDGSPVRLAVMCPASKIWQDTMFNTVRKLVYETGVDGVYMDQIATSRPVPCYDASHGHPVGGGSWWTEQGYWPLVKRIRKEIAPKNAILTSEDNAEVYASCFDGFLGWALQKENAVPMFAAVYAGAIEIFGRAYYGKETAGHFMKAGQSLVFGEQIGWLDPKIVLENEAGPFIAMASRIHYRYRRYFSAGELARPPLMASPIPAMTADWGWHKQPPVTADALMTGAWQLKQGLLHLFVNVSPEPISAVCMFSAARYGLQKKVFDVRIVSNEVEMQKETISASETRTFTVPPRSVIVWEIQ